MVYLLAGPKGTGKTQQMIEQANEAAKKCNGNVVFIKKTHRDTASVTFDIRTICMDDFPAITNIDEYIGFLYGMYSSNHDIEYVFIDGILKHADISLDNIPAFIDRLKQVSKECEVEFYVSISANKEELALNAWLTSPRTSADNTTLQSGLTNPKIATFDTSLCASRTDQSVYATADTIARYRINTAPATDI